MFFVGAGHLRKGGVIEEKTNGTKANSVAVIYLVRLGKLSTRVCKTCSVTETKLGKGQHACM